MTDEHTTEFLRKREYDHSDTYKVRLIIGAAALIVFFLMHYLYTSGTGLAFDLAAGEAVRSLRSPALSSVLIPITHLANWKTLVGIGAALLAVDAVKWKKYDYPLAVASCLITLLIYKILKSVVQRPRPNEMFWLVAESGYSFPSGHSMNGMFCYGMMIYVLLRNCKDDRIRIAAAAVLAALIPLIAFSRVYVGVHHPTDVMAGLSAGLALLMPATVLVDEILLRLDSRSPAAV